MAHPIRVELGTRHTVQLASLAPAPLAGAVRDGLAAAAPKRLAAAALAALLAGGMLAPVDALQAATITVNTLDGGAIDASGNCSFVEAVAAANTNAAVDACPAGDAGLDYIKFSVAGTITLTNGSTINVTEYVNIDGAGQVTISGGNTQGILASTSAATLDINSLDLTNAFKPAVYVVGIGYTGGLGGAIDARGPLYVDDSTLSYNEASYGGAIFHSDYALISNSRLTRNIAYTRATDPVDRDGRGGAAYIVGNAHFENSVIDNNYAFALGGGVQISGAARIERSGVYDNIGFFGGGIGNSYGGGLFLRSSTVAGNQGAAGALFQGFGAGNTSDIRNSTFAGNSGSDGSVYFFEGTADLDFVTITMKRQARAAR